METIITEPQPAKAGKAGKAPKEPKPPKAPKEPRAPREPKAAKPVKEKAAPVPKAPVWGSPVKPSLMLLPVKSRGLKARRTAVRHALIGSLGMLGLTAAGYLFVIAGVAGAQAEVNKERDVTVRQTAILNKHQAVQDYANGFIERKIAAAAALEQDTAYSRVLEAIQGANTVGAVFTSIHTPEAGAPCTSPTPFAASSAISCLDVSGTAPSIPAVGELVASLNKNPDMLKDAYVTEATAGEEGISFKLSVGYTSNALTMKGQKFQPTDEEMATIENPAATAVVPQGETK